jgi:hypothetical protein
MTGRDARINHRVGAHRRSGPDDFPRPVLDPRDEPRLDRGAEVGEWGEGGNELDRTNRRRADGARRIGEHRRANAKAVRERRDGIHAALHPELHRHRVS